MEETTKVPRADLERLAAKLDALDLADQERALLVAVFEAAGRELAGGEVEGYDVATVTVRVRPGSEAPRPIGGFFDVFVEVFQPGTRIPTGEGRFFDPCI